MDIDKDKINEALDNLEEMAKGDQGANAPLNSAEGDDMGASRGKPLSDEAKKKKGKHAKSDYSDKGNEMSKKSFAEEMPEEITETVDVSDFLKSLVDHTGAKFDELAEHVAKGELSNTQANEEVVERLGDIEKSQAMIGVVLKSVCEKLGIIENAAAHEPKSETTVVKSGVSERNFQEPEKETETENKLFKSLSTNPMAAKRQVSAALCDLVKSGEAEDTDVINFEMSQYIRPELVTKLKQTLD